MEKTKFKSPIQVVFNTPKTNPIKPWRKSYISKENKKSKTNSLHQGPYWLNIGLE